MGVNVKADIQDKDGAVKKGSTSMSKPRSMTKMNATNVTVEIWDKEKVFKFN